MLIWDTSYFLDLSLLVSAAILDCHSFPFSLWAPSIPGLLGVIRQTKMCWQKVQKKVFYLKRGTLKEKVKGTEVQVQTTWWYFFPPSIKILGYYLKMSMCSLKLLSKLKLLDNNQKFWLMDDNFFSVTDTNFSSWQHVYRLGSSINYYSYSNY